MITAGSAPFVFCQQRLDVQFVHYTIDHPHQMMFGDQFVQSRRQQIHLLHAKGFEGDLSFVHAPFILNFHPFEEGLPIPFLDSPSCKILSFVIGLFLINRHDRFLGWFLVEELQKQGNNFG